MTFDEALPKVAVNDCTRTPQDVWVLGLYRAMKALRTNGILFHRNDPIAVTITHAGR
jgi:hypothetical protein